MSSIKKSLRRNGFFFFSTFISEYQSIIIHNFQYLLVNIVSARYFSYINVSVASSISFIFIIFGAHKSFSIIRDYRNVLCVSRLTKDLSFSLPPRALASLKATCQLIPTSLLSVIRTLNNWRHGR